MRVGELFGQGKPVFSFEFFLPKTPEGLEGFKKVVGDLKALAPSFVTLTYGAGGSARDRTIDAAGMIKNELGIETVSHLTCIAHSRFEIQQVLGKIHALGIENIMALRGDMPKDGTPVSQEYGHAVELVKDIRTFGGFCVGVAGYPEKHPEAKSFDEDLNHLKEKVDAGSDFITTQLFFDNQDYFKFVKKVRDLGINLPVLPGLMPVTNHAQLERFSKMCGARIPPQLAIELWDVREDNDAVIHRGIEWTYRQAKELLDGGAPGIHFYTLNKSLSTQVVLARLKEKL